MCFVTCHLWPLALWRPTKHIQTIACRRWAALFSPTHYSMVFWRNSHSIQKAVTGLGSDENCNTVGEIKQQTRRKRNDFFRGSTLAVVTVWKIMWRAVYWFCYVTQTTAPSFTLQRIHSISTLYSKHPLLPTVPLSLCNWIMAVSVANAQNPADQMSV